ncbi:LLM class flavin-dependent oxidoreductase [Aquisediminimonas profunda]|uniref:LLM class flavin-dependent oxidoreductase n=1 Tax=Aquisediminimonas profunda TaxID=1550733 RepID=UPI001C62A912|nr:LLM class flavin-dependent oxidoreductase [Aquisediminimonas profunda]
MIIDIFAELQRAEDWSSKGEASVFRNAIEQGRLADELGYGAWWTVEHHGATEFSLSSAPELFHVALAMTTKRLRVGHAGVLTPFKVNHPVRIAERAAMLDILSNGRLELGLARSSANEWEVFDVPKEVTQAQFNELSAMLPKMWADEPFSWNSDQVRIPEMNVVPKPLQKFPRLWACGQSLEGAHNAGRLGLGFLGVTVMESLDKTIALKREFEKGAEERSSDIGQPNLDYALFTFTHCAPSREAAIESRAAESAMWYVNRAASYFKVPREGLIAGVRGSAALDDVSWRQQSYANRAPEACDPDDPHPVIRLLNRQYLGMPIDPEEAYEGLAGIDSVIFGDPDTCLRKIKKIQSIGVDRLLTLQQFGHLSHEQVCSSINLLGKEVIPQLSASAPLECVAAA